MALFRNNPNGGIMDVIRCDETGYLIWKWHPSGSLQGDSAKENAIRWGSSLRVKTGEVAVFVYHNNGETAQDIILGPYDSIVKTENLPIITSAIGLAYNGNTPFQAEVYFINLAQILQVKIGVPYFDVADPRFRERGVPTSVRGVISFSISDPVAFINKYQLRTVSLDEFKGVIKAAVTKYVKAVVANAPDEYGIPVTQLEKRILEINEIIEQHLKIRLQDEYGVAVSSVDISDIEIDKTSDNYKFLIKKTDVGVNLGVAAQVRNFVTDSFTQATGAATDAVSRAVDTGLGKVAQVAELGYNVVDSFSDLGIDKADKVADFGIQRAAQVAELATDTATAAVDVKEYGYAKHKKTQSGFVKSLFKGTGDLSTAERRPSFSSNISKNVTGFVSGIGSKIGKQGKDDQAPPALPAFNYHVAVEGSAVGPLNYDELVDLIRQGKMSPDSLVWKKGMKDWTKARDVDELSVLFYAEDEVPPLPGNL